MGMNVALSYELWTVELSPRNVAEKISALQ